MKEWLAILLCSLSSLSTVAIAQPSADPTSTTPALDKVAPTYRSIVEWETTTGISLSSEAKILTSEALDAFFSSNQGLPEARFTRAYLYEVRDTYPVGTVSLNESQVSAISISGFARQFLGMHGPVSTFHDDHGKHKPANAGSTAASQQKFYTANFDKPVGYLRCTSDEPNASILINGKPKGRTVREFVLSTGSHRIEIHTSKRRCQGTVTIGRDEDQEFPCPPN